MTAMTISDTERREVARRLRDSAEERMEVKGTGNGNNWSWLYRSIFGHYMGTEKGAKGRYAEVAHRLADLIEPSCDAAATHTDASATRDVSQCRRSDVDRDALLELSEDVMEAAAMATAMDASKSAELLAELLLDIARRIREALGVEGGSR